MNDDWREAAKRLFGPNWMKPLSEVLEVNYRTVQRWAPDDALHGPRPELAAAICDAANIAGNDARRIGAILRATVGVGDDQIDQLVDAAKKSPIRET